MISESFIAGTTAAHEDVTQGRVTRAHGCAESLTTVGRAQCEAFYDEEGVEYWDGYKTMLEGMGF